MLSTHNVDRLPIWSPERWSACAEEIVRLHRSQCAVKMGHEIALIAACAGNQPEVCVFVVAPSVQGVFREECNGFSVGRPGWERSTEIASGETLQFTTRNRNRPDIASKARIGIRGAICHKRDQRAIRRPSRLISVKIARCELMRLSVRIVQIEQKELGATLDITACVEARE